MKKIDVDILENTHVTICRRQPNLQPAKKVEFLKIDCTNRSNVKKEVKVTKRPNVENESFRSYDALSILMIKGIIQVEILHKIQRDNSSGDFA